MEHKQLDVWKDSIDLVTEIYKITKEFPKEEIYSLITQIRRAAISIPCNIAEGAARKSDKEFIQFLYVALGSLAEVETQIIISEKLNYIDNPKSLLDKVLKVKQMILGLIKYLNKKKGNNLV
ncbi:MAG: four helix bundle protein [Candidatus Eremiobacterota bacterium]